MKFIGIEESGWRLQYDDNLQPLSISIIDAVPGGTRGTISFTESDIRAFKILFNKFIELKKKESELEEASKLLNEHELL